MSEQPQPEEFETLFSDEPNESGQTTLNEHELEISKLLADRKAAKKQSIEEQRREALRTSVQNGPGDTIPDPDDGEVPEDDIEPPESSERETPGQTAQPPSSPDSTPPPFSYKYNDVDFTEDQVRQGLDYYNWGKQLNEQAQQGINAFLSGTHVLVERGEFERFQKGQPNAQQTETKTQTPSPSELLTPEELEDLPPGVLKILEDNAKKNQEQWEEVRQWRQQQEQQTQQANTQQYQQQIEIAVANATKSIKERYALTDEEFNQLDKLTESSNRVAVEFTANGGNPEAALLEAFDWNYQRNFADRERQRVFLAMKTAELEAENNKQEVQNRKKNAGALSPAGASVPASSRTYKKTGNKAIDNAARRANLVDDINEWMSQ